MQRRFTIIQGGLSENRRDRAVSDEAWDATRIAGWRVALRRPGGLDEDEVAQWRVLAERAAPHDPFADPDFLVIAAQHALGNGVAFALAFARTATGAERLAGVVPLELPHPVWGGSTVRLWHPVLAPRPVEPLFATGVAPAAIEAVMRHLDSSRPLASLRLSRLLLQGDLLRVLRGDARFRVEARPGAASIPDGQFVTIGGRETVAGIERIDVPECMRDAVERFLLLDARRSRRPLLSDPGVAATIRVVTRLLARRGLAEVELGRADGEDVSGAIRLGSAGARIVWHSVNRGGRNTVLPATVDVDLTLAEGSRHAPPAARLKLVASEV